MKIFQLLRSHRGQRGSLSSRIRAAIFRVYREKNLPFINLKAAPNEIKKWKESSVVKECYDSLHSKINDNDDTTWCGRIINRLWPDLSKAPSEQIAFAVSLCEFFLNPKNENIKNDNKYLRIMTKKNNVSRK